MNYILSFLAHHVQQTQTQNKIKWETGWRTVKNIGRIFLFARFLLPVTKLGQGNIFRSVCQEFCPQGEGHVWQMWGAWQGTCLVGGACVVGGRGVCGKGECMVRACVVGGMHGRGCVQQGGMHGKGTCMARGGMCGGCMARGCVQQGGMHGKGTCMARGGMCGGCMARGGMCGRGMCMVRGMHGRGHATGMHSCWICIKELIFFSGFFSCQVTTFLDRNIKWGNLFIRAWWQT